jgi:ComF family protein
MGFMLARHCRCCGTPLPNVSADEPICGRCLDEPPVFERARSALRYDGVARRLVLRFKHGDRTDGAATFAKWMARAGAPLIQEADVIVPVPLHRWRLARRSYNQSALLALELGRLSRKPVSVDGLIKRQSTRAQQQLSAADRRLNLRPEHFGLGRKAPALVTGRRVLLVDDVFTTGNTVNVCARCLLAHGAQAVDVLTLARVVRDDDAPISN